jgi:hypothetical protein
MNLPVVSLLVLFSGLEVFAPPGLAQSLAPRPASTVAVVTTSAPRSLDLTYHRPNEKTKLRNYFFDTFGPGQNRALS